AVAQPGCKDPPVPALWVEREHRSTIDFVVPGTAKTVLGFPASDRLRIALAHPLSDVRCRADRDEHLPAVFGESDVARGMAALHRTASGSSKLVYNHLGFRARLGIAAAIRVADDRAGISDIKPPRICSGRIKGHAERLI